MTLVTAPAKLTKLGEMKKGFRGQIVSVGKDSQDPELVRRLLEMGLLEGTWVEIIHEAPFGKDPIAVKVRGALLALRRREANCIEVSL
jgi:ferrous iron transport protein A